MVILENGINLSTEMENLQENTLALKRSSTKINSRKLHLQELIAKRDRLDFEIRHLKQKISEERRPIRKATKSLIEQVDNYGKILQESLVGKDPTSSYVTAYHNAYSTIEYIEELYRTIDWLINLKPFSEEDQF